MMILIGDPMHKASGNPIHDKICQSYFENINGRSLTNMNILISNSMQKANGKPDKIC